MWEKKTSHRHNRTTCNRFTEWLANVLKSFLRVGLWSLHNCIHFTFQLAAFQFYCFSWSYCKITLRSNLDWEDSLANKTRTSRWLVECKCQSHQLLVPPAASHHYQQTVQLSVIISYHVVYLKLTFNCSICWVDIKPKYGFSTHLEFLISCGGSFWERWCVLNIIACFFI